MDDLSWSQIVVMMMPLVVAAPYVYLALSAHLSRNQYIENLKARRGFTVTIGSDGSVSVNQDELKRSLEDVARSAAAHGGQEP